MLLLNGVGGCQGVHVPECRIVSALMLAAETMNGVPEVVDLPADDSEIVLTFPAVQYVVCHGRWEVDYPASTCQMYVFRCRFAWFGHGLSISFKSSSRHSWISMRASMHDGTSTY